MASDREITIQELSTHPVAYGQHELDTVGFTMQSWFHGEARANLGRPGRRGQIWWRHVGQKSQRREIMQSFNVKKNQTGGMAQLFQEWIWRRGWIWSKYIVWSYQVTNKKSFKKRKLSIVWDILMHWGKKHTGNREKWVLRISLLALRQ